MRYEDAYAQLARRFHQAHQRGHTRVVCCGWASRTGLAYWAGLLRHEPREAGYVIPRRLACRLLRRHNDTCIGRRGHVARW